MGREFPGPSLHTGCRSAFSCGWWPADAPCFVWSPAPNLTPELSACSRLTQVSLSQEGRGSPAQFPCGWRACSPAPPEWGGRPQPHVVPAPRSGDQRVLAGLLRPPQHHMVPTPQSRDQGVPVGLLPPPQHHPRLPHRPRGAGQLWARTLAREALCRFLHPRACSFSPTAPPHSCFRPPERKEKEGG